LRERDDGDVRQSSKAVVGLLLLIASLLSAGLESLPCSLLRQRQEEEEGLLGVST